MTALRRLVIASLFAAALLAGCGGGNSAPTAVPNSAPGGTTPAAGTPAPAPSGDAYPYPYPAP